MLRTYAVTTTGLLSIPAPIWMHKLRVKREGLGGELPKLWLLIWRGDPKVVRAPMKCFELEQLSNYREVDFMTRSDALHLAIVHVKPNISEVSGGLIVNTRAMHDLPSDNKAPALELGTRWEVSFVVECGVGAEDGKGDTTFMRIDQFGTTLEQAAWMQAYDVTESACDFGTARF